MEHYSTKKLVSLSGVTKQTLQHYKRLGLLKPNAKAQFNQSAYSKNDLIRLLQILFYKEFDFTLLEIRNMIDDPTLDIKKIMEGRKKKNVRVQTGLLNDFLQTINKKIKKSRALQAKQDAINLLNNRDEMLEQLNSELDDIDDN